MTAADQGSMWLAVATKTGLPLLIMLAVLAGTLAVAAIVLRDGRQLPVACLFVVALAMQLPLMTPGDTPQDVLLFKQGFALCLLPAAAALFAALLVQCMPAPQRQQAFRPLAIVACTALAVAVPATFIHSLHTSLAYALPLQLATSALVYFAGLALAFNQFNNAPDFIGPLALAVIGSGFFLLRAVVIMATPTLGLWPASLLLLLEAACVSSAALIIAANNSGAVRRVIQIQNNTTAPALRVSRHDLRAPLSDIVGLAELIADQPLDKRQREHLVMLSNAAHRALQHVNELYRFSGQTAIEQNPMQANGQNFRPELLIEECCQQYRGQLEDSSAGLVVDIHQNVPRSMRAEHSVLRQLISLCLKYSIVERKQTGILLDIAAHNHNQLLIRFVYNAQAAGSDDPEAGTDRSVLSTAISLASANGGAIELIESESALAESHNTRTNAGLQLSFPAQSDRRTSSTADYPDILSGQRVLVVDDNAVSLRVIEAYLNRWKVNVYTANTAANARALVLNQRALGQAIDAAIIDFRLPDATGLEFVESLISDQTIVPLPAFILMSDSAGAISTRSARNHGIHHVLEKPVFAETLQLKLLEALYLQESIGDGFKRNKGSDASNSTARPTNLRVLLVEDDPISRKVTGSLLRAQGWHQDAAIDAASAITAFEKSNYDIVILDCNLPDSSGFDVARSIRRIEKKRQSQGDNGAKIYSLSADDDPQLAEQSMEAKLDGHLVKPVTTGDLKIMQRYR